MKKTLITLISIIAFAFTVSAQNVDIPDANFKAYLLGNSAINTDADKLEISVAEAISYNGVLEVENKYIYFMIGIEAFINLTKLNCSSNQLTNLDVSKNTALIELVCYNNQLTSLDITNCTALTKLSCSGNKLTNLDVTKNTALTNLSCSGYQLTNLDVSKNTALIELFCGGNKLTNLDVTNNTALTQLSCMNTKLTRLDVSKNTALTNLDCMNTQLTSLDITKNTALTKLNCSSNQLTRLDVSKNTALTQLGCYNNPNLKCIQAFNSQNKSDWWRGENAQYSENCNYTVGLNDELLTQPKTISTIYNLQGQAVNTGYQGLVIIRYTDGTIEKVLQ
jgi:Leucine-rich repeat (LRR) protein